MIKPGSIIGNTLMKSFAIFLPLFHQLLQHARKDHFKDVGTGSSQLVTNGVCAWRKLGMQLPTDAPPMIM
jgi:hypothetical protein